MSYDLHLYRKNKVKEPFLPIELEKLHDIFDTKIIESDDENRVLEFSVKYKNTDSEPDEFYYQKDGSYWTYVSYGATKEQFDHFLKLVDELSLLLDVDIEDPQLDEKLVSPTDHQQEQVKSRKRFNFARTVTEKVIHDFLDSRDFIIPIMVPAQGKYFTKYLISSVNPATNKTVLLTLGQKSIYCSKVIPGETLHEVIEREIPLLTGSHEYKLANITDDGTDFDREGNKLLRVSLIINVPYFDPKEKRLEYPLVWEEI